MEEKECRDKGEAANSAALGRILVLPTYQNPQQMEDVNILHAREDHLRPD